MVYCVQAALVFSTAARRNTILTGLTNLLSGRARWGVDVLGASGFRQGPNGIAVSLRFTTRANADDILVRLDELIAVNPSLRTPSAGSWLTIHDCAHDEGDGSCSPDVRRDW